MSLLRQVKASAGSGKTYQLTRRFLSLLDGAEDTKAHFVCTGRVRKGFTWPEIMAVTFTNKAAAEMKERVVTGLKQAALCQSDQQDVCSTETARRTLSAILRRYHRLNIRTIDSLLALLLRLFALEFGIRPDFEIIFDEQELFDGIFDHFISLCETDEAEHLLLDNALDSLIRLEGRKGFWLDTSVRGRLRDLMEVLDKTPQDLLTDTEAIRKLLIKEYDSYRKALARMMELVETTSLPIAANFKKALAKLDGFELMDMPDMSSVYVRKDSFQDCVNKKGKPLVQDKEEALYAHFKESCERYASIQPALLGAMHLAPAIAIASTLREELAGVEREKGVVLNAGLPGHVNRLLTRGDSVSEAYCRLGCRLHHLMVDEFQDTSREQWEAIAPLTQECLAKGGSLYYVGDVKQAIYGWRGGDASLFDEIMETPDIAGLAEDTDKDTLPNNWRSFKNVVEFNNTFFGNLERYDETLELAEQILPGAGQTFTDDFASKVNAGFLNCAQAMPDKNADTEGYVKLEQLEGGRNAEIEEQTLEKLDQLMEDLTARRPYRDIGILVRSHKHAGLVCDLLVQKNIPVITENSLQLDRHPLIRQLVGLLGFLDYPRDDVSFLTFVAGNELFQSEARINPEALNEWLVKPRKKPLGVQFRQDYPDVWQRLIEPFYNQSGLMTPYDLSREALRVYRAFERHPEAELYLRRFLEVVHLAEENGYTSLAAFLEYWNDKSDQEKVPLPENIDAVRIMTIYKSKGLEFPVAIVPFHNWDAKPDRQYAEVEIDGHALLTPMKKDLGAPYFESMGRTAREQLNLLYVAWTRAREELYGFFTEKPASSPTLAAMNQFLELDEEGIFEVGTTPVETRVSTPQPPAQPTELPESDETADLMGWLPRLRVYRHNLEDYFYNERMRGEVAHRVMERITVTGDDTADTERAIRMATAEFPELDGLTDEDNSTLRLELEAMTLWALKQDDLRAWLTHGLREPEVMDASGEFKRFDLLYRGKETVVVDFKTGQPTPKNEEQVREYMDILDDLPGVHAPKGYLIYLDRREIKEVRRDS